MKFITLINVEQGAIKFKKVKGLSLIISKEGLKDGKD